MGGGLLSCPPPLRPRRPSRRRSPLQRLPRLVRAWVATAAMAHAGACATVPRHGPSAPFAVYGQPPDATVWIDDRRMGTVAELTLSPRRIAAGFHRVEVRSPGFESHLQELEVKPDVPQIVRFDLHEVLQ